MLPLRNRVTGLATHIADTRAAIAEAMRRQEEAEKRESEQEIQDLRAEAERLAGEFKTAYRDFAVALQIVREKHSITDRLKARLDSVNSSLETLGRPALRVKVANAREQIADELNGTTYPGLTSNGRAVDQLLASIGTPRQAIRIDPRHRRISTQGPTIHG